MNMYEKSFADIFTYLAKRAVMLIAKLLGFKTFCLMLTTVLLKHHIVSENVWQSIMITVICAAGGMRLADAYSVAAAARKPGCGSGTQFKPEGEENYEEETEAYDTAANSSVPCSRTNDAAAGIQRAAGMGKERIRALLASECAETADAGRTACSGSTTGHNRPDAAGNAGTTGAD
jgi:hypothetical protein